METVSVLARIGRKQLTITPKKDTAHVPAHPPGLQQNSRSTTCVAGPALRDSYLVHTIFRTSPGPWRYFRFRTTPFISRGVGDGRGPVHERTVPPIVRQYRCGFRVHLLPGQPQKFNRADHARIKRTRAGVVSTVPTYVPRTATRNGGRWECAFSRFKFGGWIRNGGRMENHLGTYVARRSHSSDTRIESWFVTRYSNI